MSGRAARICSMRVTNHSTGEWRRDSACETSCARTMTPTYGRPARCSPNQPGDAAGDLVGRRQHPQPVGPLHGTGRQFQRLGGADLPHPPRARIGPPRSGVIVSGYRADNSRTVAAPTVGAGYCQRSTRCAPNASPTGQQYANRRPSISASDSAPSTERSRLPNPCVGRLTATKDGGAAAPTHPAVPGARAPSADAAAVTGWSRRILDRLAAPRRHVGARAPVLARRVGGGLGRFGTVAGRAVAVVAVGLGRDTIQHDAEHVGVRLLERAQRIGHWPARRSAAGGRSAVRGGRGARPRAHPTPDGPAQRRRPPAATARSRARPGRSGSTSPSAAPTSPASAAAAACPAARGPEASTSSGRSWP